MSPRALAVWHDGVPWPVRVAFFGLVAVVVGLAVHGLIGVGGGTDIHTFFDAWLSCAAEWLAALICAVGALRSERNRGAWLLVAGAMAAWALGDTIWSIRGDPRRR